MSRMPIDHATTTASGASVPTPPTLHNAELPTDVTQHDNGASVL